MECLIGTTATGNEFIQENRDCRVFIVIMWITTFIDGNHFIMRALDKCGQVTKGAWGMSWYQEAMKGVEVCEKLGGADKQVMIPGFLN